MEPIVPDPWWWDSASTITAAIIGALIGAIPAFLLANRSSREILARDATARNLANQAVVQRIVIKLLALLDVLGDLRRHFNESFAKAETAERTTFEPWQLVLPVTGQSANDVPTFSADELAVMFSAGESKLMQQMMLFQRRCASAYVSFATYCEKRSALEAMLPAPVGWQGNMGTMLLTAEQVNRFRPYTIPLNTLLLSLRDHLEEDWKLGLSLADQFTTFARIHLQRPNLAISLPEDGSDADGSPADPSSTR